MQNTRVATVQMEHTDADKAANFAKLESFVAAAEKENVELISFPECCLTGYWFLRRLTRPQLQDLAEPVPEGPSSARLMQLARRHTMTVAAGLVELAPDGQLYNTYVVAMPDGRFARHRKIHCFISPHLASGSEYTVFDLPNGTKTGILICYDNNLPENCRVTALMGAEILLAPHQTGGCQTGCVHSLGPIDPALWHNRKQNPAPIEAEFQGPKGRQWLMRWLPTRAFDNGMFLIFSNGVGVDDDEIRTGNATIFDCFGRILAATDRPEDVMLTADLDASLRANCDGCRRIRARRPELYAPLTQTTGREQDIRAVRFHYLDPD